MKPTRGLMLFGASAIVAACGGGGGGGSSAPVVPATSAGGTSAPNNDLTIPIAAALSNLIGQNRTTPLTMDGSAAVIGLSGATSYFHLNGTGTLSETVASAAFEGGSSLKKTTTLSGTVVGMSSPQDLSTTKQEFFSSDYKPLGSQTDGIYCVTTSYTPPPTNIAMGKFSLWFLEDCFSGPDKLKKIGTSGNSYTVSPETGTSATVNIGRRVAYTNGTLVDSETTYSIDTTGNIKRVFGKGPPVTVGSTTMDLIIYYK